MYQTHKKLDGVSVKLEDVAVKVEDQDKKIDDLLKRVESVEALHAERRQMPSSPVASISSFQSSSPSSESSSKKRKGLTSSPTGSESDGMVGFTYHQCVFLILILPSVIFFSKINTDVYSYEIVLLLLL